MAIEDIERRRLLAATFQVFPLDEQDSLVLDTACSVVGVNLSLFVRVRMPDGRVNQMVFNQALLSDRSILRNRFRLGPGSLLSVVALHDSVAVGVNDCYVRVALSRDPLTADSGQMVLFQGYATYGGSLSWPGSGSIQPGSGVGSPRAVLGSVPAPGAEIVYTVPTNSHLKVTGIRFNLTTDATVATRRVVLIVDDGTTECVRRLVVTTQAASITALYHFFPWGAAEAVSTSVYMIPFPSFQCAEGWRIQTLTTLIQAGDQYTAPVLLARDSIST